MNQFLPRPDVFEKYPKIGRLKGAGMTITEKIDGTNAQIVISNEIIIGVGSRKRAILPNVDVMRDEAGRTIRDSLGMPLRPKQVRDNFGFAAWVRDNAAGLVEFLGEGTHYGEWAGPGIQKNPLGLEARRFFVFNTHRNPPEKFAALGDLVEGLDAVPVVFEGQFNLDMIDLIHQQLLESGSHVEGAAFPNIPEGIVISVFGSKFKRTLDDRPKGTR